MTFCSECGHEIYNTAKFCSDCGTKINKDLNTISTNSIDTISSPIKSYSKVSSFRNTLTSTASKIGEKLSHSKSSIGIPQI